MSRLVKLVWLMSLVRSMRTIGLFRSLINLRLVMLESFVRLVR